MTHEVSQDAAVERPSTRIYQAVLQFGGNKNIKARFTRNRQ